MIHCLQNNSSNDVKIYNVPNEHINGGDPDPNTKQISFEVMNIVKYI